MDADEVIKLVHEIDRLETEKRKINERIAQLKMQLNGNLRGVSVAINKAVIAKKGRRATEQAVISALQAYPNADYGVLTLRLYGEDNARTRAAARGIMSNLRERGLVAGEPGKWIVLSKDGD